MSFPLIFLSSVKDTSFYPHQRHNSLSCNHPIIYYFVTYYQVIPTKERLAKLTEAQYAITQEGCTERWLNILLLLKKLTINGIQENKKVLQWFLRRTDSPNFGIPTNFWDHGWLAKLREKLASGNWNNQILIGGSLPKPNLPKPSLITVD